MGTITHITWCDHTFNPWVGCQAISSACDSCYAEALVKRWGGDFATRRRTALANWRKPLAWNKAATAAGVRRRVFCASLADAFDNKVPPEWRTDLWDLIRACPALDWQLLSKRPQNIADMLPPDWGQGWPNVWLGATVEHQTEANRRIPHLLGVPAAVRFLSCEPLLGPVDLTNIQPPGAGHGDAHGWSAVWTGNALGRPVLDWVIIGGESGPGARPTQRTWVTDLLRQCEAAEVQVFFKQIGSARDLSWPAGITGKGDDPVQWPPRLRVQRFPQPIGGADA